MDGIEQRLARLLSALRHQQHHHQQHDDDSCEAEEAEEAEEEEAIQTQLVTAPHPPSPTSTTSTTSTSSSSSSSSSSSEHPLTQLEQLILEVGELTATHSPRGGSRGSRGNSTTSSTGSASPSLAAATSASSSPALAATPSNSTTPLSTPPLLSTVQPSPSPTLRPPAAAADAVPPLLLPRSKQQVAAAAEERWTPSVEGIAALLEVLNSPLVSAEAHCHASRALFNLSVEDYVQAALLEHPLGLAGLVKRLASPAEQTQMFACGTLANLAATREEAKMRIYEQSGALDLLINALRSPNESVQRQSCRALLAMSGHRVLCHRLPLHGAIHPLLRCLDSSNEHVVWLACGSLANLAKLDFNKQLIVKAEGLAPIARLARSWSRRVQKEAARLLFTLAASAGVREAIVDEGCIAPLIELTSATNVSVARNALGALANIAVEDEHKEALVNEGGVPALIRMASHTHASVHRQASRGLFTLSAKSDICALILRQGGLRPAVRLLERSEDLPTLCDMAGFIANIAIQDEFRTIVAEGGAVLPLLNLCHSRSLRVRQQAARALCLLAMNARVKRILTDRNGAADLMALLRETVDPIVADRESNLGAPVLLEPDGQETPPPSVYTPALGGLCRSTSDSGTAQAVAATNPSAPDTTTRQPAQAPPGKAVDRALFLRYITSIITELSDVAENRTTLVRAGALDTFLCMLHSNGVSINVKEQAVRMLHRLGVTMASHVPHQHSSLRRDMLRLLRSGVMADVIFLVENRPLLGHRPIVASRCQLVREMIAEAVERGDYCERNRISDLVDAALAAERAKLQRSLGQEAAMEEEHAAVQPESLDVDDDDEDNTTPRGSERLLVVHVPNIDTRTWTAFLEYLYTDHPGETIADAVVRSRLLTVSHLANLEHLSALIEGLQPDLVVSHRVTRQSTYFDDLAGLVDATVGSDFTFLVDWDRTYEGVESIVRALLQPVATSSNEQLVRERSYGDFVEANMPRQEEEEDDDELSPRKAGNKTWSSVQTAYVRHQRERAFTHVPFHTHKAVLCARSEYFHAMFISSGMHEERSAHMGLPQHSSYAVIHLLMQYLYAGRVEWPTQVFDVPAADGDDNGQTKPAAAPTKEPTDKSSGGVMRRSSEFLATHVWNSRLLSWFRKGKSPSAAAAAAAAAPAPPADPSTASDRDLYQLQVALHLMKLADHCMLFDLKFVAQRHAMRFVTLDNVMYVLLVAHHFQGVYLRTMCIQFVLEHRQELDQRALGRVPHELKEEVEQLERAWGYAGADKPATLLFKECAVM